MVDTPPGKDLLYVKRFSWEIAERQTDTQTGPILLGSADLGGKYPSPSVVCDSSAKGEAYIVLHQNEWCYSGTGTLDIIMS